MQTKKIICRDCKKEFTAKITSRYSRKYCDECSKKRKKDYENLYSVKFEDCDDD
ncbi:MAG: hypothetical protein Q8N99_04970 [Nanoarchaeota archaeon]|nr:hypothetical protein [Nanoarchaeota archaeon]